MQDGFSLDLFWHQWGFKRIVHTDISPGPGQGPVGD